MTEAVTEPGAEAAPAARPAAGGPPGGAAPPDPRRWLALGVVLTASFMVLLDISIVNVAIPSIQSNLHATFAQVQFVLAGYALAYAVFLITGGRLGDIYGRRRLFMIGMAGFTVASALCGLAQSPEMLVASRVLQGLMAALMYPQVLSVIQVSFPPRERGAAFGIFGSVIGVATITGPLLGGLIIRSDITGSSWRYVFLVNVPVGIGSLVAAYRLLHESKAPQAHRLDLAGVVVVTGALLLLVYPMVEGRDLGWPWWSFALLAASPLVFAVFALMERRIDAGGGAPLVRLSLFHNRSFTVGLVGACAFFSGVPSFFFVFSLHLQIGLGFSALHAGLTTLPFALGSATASAMSVRLAPRLGKRILHIGCAGLVVGMLGVMATLHWRGNDLNGFDLIPSLLLAGIGLGCFVAPVLNIILAGIEGRDAGAASGVLTTIQQVGGAVGVAVIGVIFFGLLGSRATLAAGSVLPQLRADLTAAQPGAAASVIDGEVARFQDCFVRRAQASDPSETPPGCPAPAAAGTTDPVAAAFARAAGGALGTDFGSSLERTLFYEVGVFSLTGVLVTFLPASRNAAPHPSPAAASA